MLKNTITVFIQVDHTTAPNGYLESLTDILSQNIPNAVKIDIVTLASNQVHPDVLKLYGDVEDVKSRFESWPEDISLRFFVSDDNSYNKIRNYTDLISEGEYGELVTFKSVAPIKWFQNHLQAHWLEYKRNKGVGYMLSRIEIKDSSKAGNEKENTFSFRLDDFPKHIDQIVPDEVFLTHAVCGVVDFNEAAIMQTAPDGSRVSMFHVGKLITDEVIPKSDDLGLQGYNPHEITLTQWIDVEAMKKAHDVSTGKVAAEQEKVQTKENEDGSTSFISEEDEDGATIFTED